MLTSFSAIAYTFQKSVFLQGTAEPKTYLSAALTGSSTSPVIPTPATAAAMLAQSEMHELFDGDIWVIPYTHNYDFNVIATPLEYSFIVYNSGKTAVTLNELFGTNAAGTSIEGVSIPYTFFANAERTFTIRATVNGERTLEGYYTFVFDTQTIIFKIYGTRAVVLSIIPSNSYSEGESYETDIFNAQNGTEKRTALVDTPKRVIKYDLTPSKNQSVEMLEEIIAYALRFYCLQPLWFSYTKAEQRQEAYTIICDTQNRDFKIGDYALIRKDFNDYVMHKVTALTQSSITFAAQISVEAGDIIVPLLPCTPESSNAFTFYNANVASFSLKLKEVLA